MPTTDPDDLPVAHCGHPECATGDCVRISDVRAQTSMWHCPVSSCRAPLFTVEHPSGRRTFEVLNADLVLIGARPILAPHDCGAWSLN